ncbi:MAG: hypothetical protein ACREVG_17515 [Burkholderiales bacterium]
MKIQRPRPAQVTYTETYDWVLDRRFMRGDSGRKSDGSQEIVMATYDPASKGYPFWIFSSSGSYTYLPPARWDEGGNAMEWKNPGGTDLNYSARCVFADSRTRRCSVLVKDWKGKVLLESEGTAVRRE